jgi:hypothetical protein
MNFFENILGILRKPFPEEDNRLTYYRNLVFISLFITLFLFIFQPFGISSLESRKFVICLGFGSMTFLGVFVYKSLRDQLHLILGKRGKWTFGKWILNNLGIMFFISLANFLFARLVLFGFIQWDLFPAMIYGTFMIGIIPLTLLGGYALFKQEKKYQTIADEINLEKKTSSIIKNIGSIAVFDIPAHQIKYIEALQNYVKIGYISVEGSLKIKTERCTLKEILEKTEGSAIIKCHRSYLVNKDAITTASGNAQGLLLTLSDCDQIIPVSRTFVPLFRTI